MSEDINQVGIAHAGVISALHGACFETSWDGQAVTGILVTAGTFALISGIGDCPRGFVLFRLAADEAEIISIGVLPPARRAGVAGRLLRASIQYAARRGAARMFLEAAADNTAGRALYEKCGFAACGRRRGYYGHRTGKTDALIYSLEITGK